MADFPINGYVYLLDAIVSEGTLSWTGIGVVEVVGSDLPVVDVDNDGALIVGVDFWPFPDFLYSGYTINHEGLDHAIFISGANALIPFHTDVSDLFNFPTGPSSTSTYQPVLTTAANCFLTGTQIATPSGDIPVEELRIGDLVLTADGRSVPVRWLARQSIANIPYTLSPKLEPVLISAGALGDGLPVADLTVSADHGMIIDGLVVNASALVNGTSIRFVPLAEMPAQFIWWHIETAAHDVILANGAASESFIDYSGRKAFDNYAEYLKLYGADRLIREMPAPRISARRQLPLSLRERLGIGSVAPDMTEIAHLLRKRAA